MRALVFVSLLLALPAAAESEVERLAVLLALRPGAVVAEVGAGDGALAVREPGVAILGAVTLAAGLPIYWFVRQPRAFAWERR